MKLIHSDADPVDVHVGGRIRELRHHLGLSQEALAKSLRVTFQQVQKYERGANRISASMMWRAAAALDVPIQAFFEGLAGAGVEAVAPDPMEVAAKAIYERARTSGLVTKTWASLDRENPWDALLLGRAFDAARLELTTSAVLAQAGAAA